MPAVRAGLQRRGLVRRPWTVRHAQLATAGLTTGLVSVESTTTSIPASRRRARPMPSARSGDHLSRPSLRPSTRGCRSSRRRSPAPAGGLVSGMARRSRPRKRTALQLAAREQPLSSLPVAQGVDIDREAGSMSRARMTRRSSTAFEDRLRPDGIDVTGLPVGGRQFLARHVVGLADDVAEQRRQAPGNSFAPPHLVRVLPGRHDAAHRVGLGMVAAAAPPPDRPDRRGGRARSGEAAPPPAGGSPRVRQARQARVRRPAGPCVWSAPTRRGAGRAPRRHRHGRCRRSPHHRSRAITRLTVCACGAAAMQ